MKPGRTMIATVLLTVFILLFLAGTTLARRLLVKGLLPGGDRPVQCLCMDDGTVYAGAEGGAGVYRSTDNGASWAEYGDGLGGEKDVMAIARRGNEILAGTWGEGVYRRSIGGADWTSLRDGLRPDDDYIRFIVFGTGGSPNTYAADPQYIYRLPWGSSTWQEMSSTGLPSVSARYVNSLFVYSDGRLYAALNSVGVYEYSGGAWQAKGDLGGRSALAMDYGPDGTLWVGTSEGVFRWSGGWVQVSGTSGWNVTALKRNPQYTDELLVGLRSGEIHRYRQSTGNWEELSLGIPSATRVWSLAFGTGEPQRLFVGAADGLYYTDMSHVTATPTPVETIPTGEPTTTSTPTDTSTSTPTATQTLTPEPTETPTSTPYALYLPLAMKNH